MGVTSPSVRWRAAVFLVMDYWRRLEVTPSGLRNGRLTLAIGSVAFAYLLVMGIVDPSTVGSGFAPFLATSAVTIVGHVISYAGQPTIDRYRLGIVVMTVGIVASFVLLIASPLGQIWTS